MTAPASTALDPLNTAVLTIACPDRGGVGMPLAPSNIDPTQLPSGFSPPADPAQRAAVSYALAQLGKPYIYGGTGPTGYDCSGLTMKAWAAAGVSLPRTSQAQAAAGRRIPLSELQPGDLVLYNSLSHVGLYVGNGVVIHAPNSTTVVKYTNLSSFGFGVRVG